MFKKFLFCLIAIFLIPIYAMASQVAYLGLKSALSSSDVVFIGKVEHVSIEQGEDRNSIYFETAVADLLKGNLPEHRNLKIVYSEDNYSKYYDPKLHTIPFSPLLSGSGHEFEFKNGDQIIVLLNSHEVIKDADYRAVMLQPITEKETCGLSCRNNY